jgi:hypothetical protein
VATKPPGRNRPVNVAVPPFLDKFLAKLARATHWDRLSEVCAVDGSVIPGSPKGVWCDYSPNRFAVEYLWQELLSKYDDKKSSASKKQETMRRFNAAEEACAETNLRLRHPDPATFSTASTGVWSVFELAKQKISGILGPLDWDEVRDRMTFTGGASPRLNRRVSAPVYKYSGVPETTYDNLALATAVITSVPLWKQRLTSEEGDLEIAIAPGNKISYVAKNYKMDRVIALEPDLNMYCQKGLGNVIRSRLRKAGMDLKTQRTNQDLAYYGSVTGGVATIDLSMASDTISLELVRLLLPPDWLAALEHCRSPLGVLPCGTRVLYRKFSSMGNGYTFELESLIFWALMQALCQAHGVSGALVAVYGDDIIVPSALAPAALELLAVCGFTPNEKKTFVKGPFRESCGKHFLSGQDVTPFFVKEDVRSLSGLFLLHNKLYRWKERQKDNHYIDHNALRGLLLWLRSLAPKQWRRPRIPNGMGDGAFIGTFDECLPNRPACTYKPGSKKPGQRDGWEGWLVNVLVDTTPLVNYFDGYLVKERLGERGPNGIAPMNREKVPIAPPEEIGWMLKALEPEPADQLRHLDEPLSGQLSLTARTRIVEILVPHFGWPARASESLSEGGGGD